MTKDNHFQQYGYDHYLKSPKRPREEGFADEPRGRMRAGPGVMTLALLLTGAVFATVIVTSYPSSDVRRGEIPIVKADLRPIKSKPEDQGGMDIANSESTILARVGEPAIQGSKGDVENLLESPDEAMTSREQAIEAAMADAEYRAPDEGLRSPSEIADAGPSADDVLQKIEEPQIAETGEGVQSMALHEAGTSPEAKDFVMSALEKTKDTAAGSASSSSPALEVKKAQINDSEVAAPDSSNLASVGASEAKPAKEGVKVESLPLPVAKAAPAVVEKPEKMAKAPEAIVEPFEEEAAVSAIEPASGMVSPAPKINAAPGGYYVQLASVPSRSGTESEWGKLQKKFGSILGGLKYRVQEASLGGRGTFYRIQAGPISRESADEICREVKAISPNGCLVVKK